MQYIYLINKLLAFKYIIILIFREISQSQSWKILFFLKFNHKFG